VGLGELVEARDAEQRHGGHDFVFENFENSYQACLTRSGEAPTLELTDGHGARAERDSFEHVAAANDTAVEQDLGPTTDCVNNFRQHVDGRPTVIELTSAVIGDIYRTDAVLHRQCRVFSGGNAL